MIQVEHLSHRFTWGNYEKHLFNDFSFSLPKGKALVLIGESGSGKTTLLKMLCGLQQFDKGELYIDGNNVRKLAINIAEKVNLSYLPQRVSDYFLEQSVEKEFLLSGLLEDANIQSILNDFNIKSLLNKHFNELSGGEIQRVACASFFASNSDLLLCDEPAAYLDKINLDLLKNRMQYELENGKTILITTGNNASNPWPFRHLELLNR
jgi:ABC-type lipoprotein export system ATPase subunit